MDNGPSCSTGDDVEPNPQADGTFSGPTTYSNGTGSSPSGLVLGDLNSDTKAIVVNDFNGDSRPDIGFSNTGACNVDTFLSNGAVTFAGQTTCVTGSMPNAMIAVDFNDNGNFRDQKTYATGSDSDPINKTELQIIMVTAD